MADLVAQCMDADPTARAGCVQAGPGALGDQRAFELGDRAQDLQRAGTWMHLWRIAGQYANISVFDVADHDALHAILSTLPLFPFMQIEVTPLARHPSAIETAG